MNTATLPALSEIKARMAKTNTLFNVEVFGKRNFDALDHIYTATARVLPPGGPMVSGREAIKKFWKDLVTSVNAKSAVLSSLDVMETGEGIVEVGQATLSVEPPGHSPAQMEVKYVVFWREEDGDWQWHVDIWNANA